MLFAFAGVKGTGGEPWGLRQRSNTDGPRQRHHHRNEQGEATRKQASPSIFYAYKHYGVY